MGPCAVINRQENKSGIQQTYSLFRTSAGLLFAALIV